MAAETGRTPDDLVQDAMAGYFQEVAETREMLEKRYDDMVEGRVQAVGGEQAVARLKNKSRDRRSPQ